MWSDGSRFCEYFEIEVIDSLTTSLIDESTIESDLVANLSKNPFQDLTVLRLIVKETAIYKIQLFDVTGKLVKTYNNGLLLSGNHEIEIAGEEVPMGVNFCKISNSKNQFINFSVVRV